MASAQFVSNVGSWMQTVGAQELMLTLTTSATLVALIQTAAGLPVVLLAVPAGAIGDLVDRRRLLIASQSFMLLAASVLAGLAFAGLVTPWVLLGADLRRRRRADADLAHVADAAARTRRAGGPNAGDRAGRGQPEPQPGDRSRHRRCAVCGDQRRRAVPGQRAELRAGHRRGRSLAGRRAPGERRRARARRRGDPRRSALCRREPGAARHPAARRAVHVLRQLDLGAAAAGRAHAAASRLRRLRASARWRGHRSGRGRGGAAAPARARDRGGADDRRHARLRRRDAGAGLRARQRAGGVGAA